MPWLIASPLLSSSHRKPMPGFNGLRVLSFESRRAKEIAQLITNNGGVPIVAPSTREIAEGLNDSEQQLIGGILAEQFDALIFMTGVGARALIAAAEAVSPRQEFLAALARTKIVVRGPKPSAVMREFNVPVAIAVPEPNTWREIVQALDANRGAFHFRPSYCSAGARRAQPGTVLSPARARRRSFSGARLSLGAARGHWAIAGRDPCARRWQD